MKKSNNINAEVHDMNEAKKSKRTFADACKECNAVTSTVFKQKFTQALNDKLRENGIH